MRLRVCLCIHRVLRTNAHAHSTHARARAQAATRARVYVALVERVRARVLCARLHGYARGRAWARKRACAHVASCLLCVHVCLCVRVYVARACALYAHECARVMCACACTHTRVRARMRMRARLRMRVCGCVRARLHEEREALLHAGPAVQHPGPRRPVPLPRRPRIGARARALHRSGARARTHLLARPEGGTGTGRPAQPVTAHPGPARPVGGIPRRPGRRGARLGDSDSSWAWSPAAGGGGQPGRTHFRRPRGPARIA